MKKILGKWFGLPLYLQIIIMMALGVIGGYIGGEKMLCIKWIGDGFLKCIKMVIVPLVFASITIGIAGVGDPKKLGRMGGKALGFYLITTALAIVIGLACVQIIKPGKGFDSKASQSLIEKNCSKTAGKLEQGKEASRPLSAVVLDLIPGNPLASMAESDMLAVIFFAVCVGLPLARMKGPGRDSVYHFFDGFQEIMILVIQGVMWIAPYGVFALMSFTIAKFGVGILLMLFKYVITVILGLLLVVLLIYVPALIFLGKIGPGRFFKGMKEALLIAFATSSSSAALPVTMRNCKALGIQDDIVSFVCPLGATVNMAGTALYQGVAAIFIAQVFGVHLTIGAQVSIVVTATLAAVGAAAVPGIGIVTLAMVLAQINVPVEGVALIMGVDRILDMFRTVLNSMGDAVTCTFIHATEGGWQNAEASAA